MTTGRFHFADFVLDPVDRRLRRDGAPVELNARYFDALALLVRERGQLVTKDRFMTEVWRGIPVTDEALTQCIRTLRRALGDDAAAPRFIATVPKHGYRFIAPMEPIAPTTSAAVPLRDGREDFALVLAAAGGGGLAGVAGGLVYGLIGISRPLANGGGATSLLSVMAVVCALVGVIGGGGVSVGLILARRMGGSSAVSSTLGGAAGGLVTGALAGLIGHDLFALLLGAAPAAMTGPGEGALLGGAVGLAAWWGCREECELHRAIAAALAAGALGGVLAVILGGRLMAGSLVELAARFPGSRLRFEAIGGLVGEDGFGPVAAALTAAGEGALFAAGVVGALVWVARIRARG